MNPQTPPPSPRQLEKVCPDAPKKKKVNCFGCRMLLQGLGGENQEMHIGANGCLGDIYSSSSS